MTKEPKKSFEGEKMALGVLLWTSLVLSGGSRGRTQREKGGKHVVCELQ